MNIKFRLLDHIGFSSETARFAEVFVGEEEHQVLMQQDLDRIEDVQKRRLGEQGNFIDKKWIDRVAKLQEQHQLNDAQTAKYLGINEVDLLSVKSGNAELSLMTKAGVLMALKLEKIIASETLKNNLNKRLKQ